MEAIFLITIAFLLVSLIILFFFFSRKIERLMTGHDAQSSFQLLNQNVQTVHQRLDSAAQTVAGMAKELSVVQEMSRQMQSFQDFFKGPKIRGSLGEQILTQLLEQYLPREQFILQYKFQTGQIVDAALKTSQGIIPVDAKFPLENYQKINQAETDEERERAKKDFTRDVKKHIQDIAKKYILPAEGTVDFALLYIPSESVYYEIVHLEQEFTRFAHELRVFPVSPNSFLYFLRILLLGMEGLKIEQSSRKILKLLAGIQQDAKRLGDTIGVATTHITNAKNAIDRVNNDYAGLTTQFNNVRLLDSGTQDEL